MSRYLGMRTTNWTALGNSRRRKGTGKHNPSRGDYEWQIEYLDSSSRVIKRETIRADHIDDARKYAFRQVKYGQAIRIDGQSFTK